MPLVPGSAEGPHLTGGPPLLLAAERAVTVTREEHHQDVLAGRHGPAVVELRPCVIGTGKHAGQRGVEVLLDRHRVGELTRQMSLRYLPLVDDVMARGRRPDCEAVLRPDHRGVQVELRLPAVDADSRCAAPPVPGPAARPAPGAVPPSRIAPEPPFATSFATRPGPVPAAAPFTTAVLPPVPGVASPWAVPTAGPPAPPVRRGRRPMVWAGVAVAGILMFASAVGHGQRPDAPATVAAAARSTAPSTVAAAPSTSPGAVTTGPAPATTAAVAAGAAAGVEADVPATRPAPRTTTPRATAARTSFPAPPPSSRRTSPAPKAEKEPDPSGCDPNYSGCVPIASDVDCAGGSGNGPRYVRGPVRVLGSDIYGLDANHDGVGCET